MHRSARGEIDVRHRWKWRPAPLPPHRSGFAEYISARFGTNKWFVRSRWTRHARKNYEVRISPQEYRRLEEAYQRYEEPWS
jgi:hypothetical protein